MKHYIKSIAALSLICLSVGCDDFKFGNAFLEKPTSDEVNIDTVFGNKVYAEQQLAQVYHSMPDHLPLNNRLSWSPLECLTDLAENFKSGGTEYHKGSITANSSNASAYSVSYNTDNGECSAVYGIRQAYIFLENVDRVPNMTDEEKKRRKGEAKMIIAYHYVDMLRNLGGMPWIDHSYDSSDDMNMTRLTIEEMVQKIGGLIDEAAAMLPWNVESNDDGRMTKAAAYALKSRMMTFVASPLFNSDQPYREGEAANLHYTWWGNYKKERWQDALNAGLAFLRENANNGNIYQLYNNGNPRQSFCSAYFDRYNHEALITSHRFTKWDLNSNAISQIRYLVGSPVLNYADMFEMKDGTKFDWNKSEHRAHPFFTEDFEEVRDPRLYETLIVTGDKFWGRKAEIYKGGREQAKKMGGGQQWRWAGMGYTGIGQRKYTQDHVNELQNKFYQCCLMRLPEIYFNIAEAMNELGKAQVKDEFGRDAYDYVNLVRARVNMPAITPTKVPAGTALREYILDERAREFGYEEVRYFDIVRWKHKDYLDVPQRILETYPLGKKVNGHYRNFEYKFKEGPFENKRNWVTYWDNKYYLCPLPLAEINKKYGLVQNPGWE